MPHNLCVDGPDSGLWVGMQEGRAGGGGWVGAWGLRRPKRCDSSEEGWAANMDFLLTGSSDQLCMQGFKLRLPFPHPAEDRKGIKEAIVAMTKAAAA